MRGWQSVKNISGYFLFFMYLALPLGATTPDIQIVGNQIRTISGGCTVRLKGMCDSGLEYDPLGSGPGSPADVVAGIAEAVTAWHANCVRLPISQDFWFGCSNYKGTPASAEAYRAIVTNVINYCSANNVYLDLDLQWSGTATSPSVPCGGAGWGTATGQQTMPDANSVTFWQSVAQTYGNNPAVLFDLFNEPYPSTWAQAVTGGGGSPGLQGLLTAIRAVGANNIVVAGGIDWSYDLTGVASQPLTDTGDGHGVLYAAHLYPNKADNTSVAWEKYVGVAVQANYAVMIEEFGPDPNTCPPTSSSVTFEPVLMNWMGGTNNENYVFSALGWNFGIQDCPYMLSSWTGYATNPHGAAVSTWLYNINQTPTPYCAGGGPTATFTPTITGTLPTSTFTPTITLTPVLHLHANPNPAGMRRSFQRL